MTLRMDWYSSRLAEGYSIAEVSESRSFSNSPTSMQHCAPVGGFVKHPLSTVLAQDRFFSDFLSLHLTIKIHKVAMMMHVSVMPHISYSAPAAALMPVGCTRLSEWPEPCLPHLTTAWYHAVVLCCGTPIQINLPG